MSTETNTTTRGPGLSVIERPSLLSAADADVLTRARRGECDPEVDGAALWALRVDGYIDQYGQTTVKTLIELGIGYGTKMVDGRLVAVKAVIS